MKMNDHLFSRLLTEMKEYTFKQLVSLHSNAVTNEKKEFSPEQAIQVKIKAESECRRRYPLDARSYFEKNECESKVFLREFISQMKKVFDLSSNKRSNVVKESESMIQQKVLIDVYYNFVQSTERKLKISIKQNTLKDPITLTMSLNIDGKEEKQTLPFDGIDKTRVVKFTLDAFSAKNFNLVRLGR